MCAHPSQEASQQQKAMAKRAVEVWLKQTGRPTDLPTT